MAAMPVETTAAGRETLLEAIRLYAVARRDADKARLENDTSPRGLQTLIDEKQIGNSLLGLCARFGRQMEEVNA